MATRLGLGGFFPNIASMPKTVSHKEQAFAVTREVFHEGTSCFDTKRGGPKSFHSLLTADDGSIHPVLDQFATGAENVNQAITLPAKLVGPFVVELSEVVLTAALGFVNSLAKDYHDVFKSGEVMSFP